MRCHTPRIEQFQRCATCMHCRIRQRAFFSFGMDVLLSLNLAETRQFFAAFFALSDHHWQVWCPAFLAFLVQRSADAHALAVMCLLRH